MIGAPGPGTCLTPMPQGGTTCARGRGTTPMGILPPCLQIYTEGIILWGTLSCSTLPKVQYYKFWGMYNFNPGYKVSFHTIFLRKLIGHNPLNTCEMGNSRRQEQRFEISN